MLLGSSAQRDEETEEAREQERLDAIHAKPLAGCTVCITGIKTPRRDEIVKHVLSMGAQHERDLTEDVTHLVADRPGSAKYRCAAALGMKVVTEHWVAALRSEWIEARPVDVAQITADHIMPPLFQLKVSMTGYESGKSLSRFPLLVLRNALTDLTSHAAGHQARARSATQSGSSSSVVTSKRRTRAGKASRTSCAGPTTRGRRRRWRT